MRGAEGEAPQGGLLLNYKTNYNSNRNSQSKGVSNQLMFVQRGKTGDDEGDGKEKEQRPRRNVDNITCNNCGEKGHYSGNNDCPTQSRLKEDSEAFRKMKQEKSSNKPPGGGDQKALVNVKYVSCSLIIVPPTKEWGEIPSSVLMFCQTSTQETRQTESINNSLSKGDSSIMHVGNTILDSEAEAGVDENWCLLNNQSTCNAFINRNALQILKMLLMDNIYLYIVTQEWHTPTRLVVYRYILILCGITPREYQTSCPLAWSRKITL